MTGMRLGVGMVLAVLALVVGCGGGGGNAADPEPSGPVQRALRFVPEGGSLYFTDLDQFRTFAGAEDLDAARASSDELSEFYKFLSAPDHPYGGSYGAYTWPEHRRNWGWNELDLVWEANVSAPGATGSVVAFNPDFELTRLTSRLVKRKFRRSTYKGVAVYSHSDLSVLSVPTGIEGVPDIPSTSIQMLNAGILEDESVAVFSYEKKDVRAMIDVARDGPSVGDDDDYAGLADRYADAAALYLAPADCGLPSRVHPSVRRPALGFKGKRYETLALVYRVEGEGETTGSIAMHYADAEDAKEDLEKRERAASGFSLISPGVSYSELFSLQDASVDGNDLILEVEPADGRLALSKLLGEEDLLFALC